MTLFSNKVNKLLFIVFKTFWSLFNINYNDLVVID